MCQKCPNKCSMVPEVQKVQKSAGRSQKYPGVHKVPPTVRQKCPQGAPNVPSGCANVPQVRPSGPQKAANAAKWTQRATLVAFWAHQDMRESKTGASRSGFRFPPPMVGPARPQSAPLAAP